MTEQEIDKIDRLTAHRFLKKCYDQTGAFIGSLFDADRPDLLVIVGTSGEIGAQIDSLRILCRKVKFEGKTNDKQQREKSEG